MTKIQHAASLMVDRAGENPMKIIRAIGLSALIVGGVISVSQSAQAAAFAGVKNAYWQTDFW